MDLLICIQTYPFIIARAINSPDSSVSKNKNSSKNCAISEYENDSPVSENNQDLEINVNVIGSSSNVPSMNNNSNPNKPVKSQFRRKNKKGNGIEVFKGIPYCSLENLNQEYLMFLKTSLYLYHTLIY